MGDYYTIEVSLRGAKPSIWRRFMIRMNAKFVDLHEAIQDACGWYNAHLFRFEDANGHILAGLPDGEDDVKYARRKNQSDPDDARLQEGETDSLRLRLRRQLAA